MGYRVLHRGEKQSLNKKVLVFSETGIKLKNQMNASSGEEY